MDIRLTKKAYAQDGVIPGFSRRQASHEIELQYIEYQQSLHDLDSVTLSIFFAAPLLACAIPSIEIDAEDTTQV